MTRFAAASDIAKAQNKAYEEAREKARKPGEPRSEDDQERQQRRMMDAAPVNREPVSQPTPEWILRDQEARRKKAEDGD